MKESTKLHLTQRSNTFNSLWKNLRTGADEDFDLELSERQNKTEVRRALAADWAAPDLSARKTMTESE